MNLKQKIILLLGIIVIVLMGIYPPWYFYKFSNGLNMGSAGYAFFTIHPPLPQKQFGYSGVLRPDTTLRADIDYTRLSFQWAMVAIATGGFLLILKDKKKLKRGDDMP